MAAGVGGFLAGLAELVRGSRDDWGFGEDGCVVVESESGVLWVFGYGGVKPSDCMRVLPGGWVRV